ncbi:MAG: TonB-dependent receptor [Spirochaetes bacterium]|nr:TonB-dependent receptor [Spirochaetota bacterium]
MKKIKIQNLIKYLALVIVILGIQNISYSQTIDAEEDSSAVNTVKEEDVELRTIVVTGTRTEKKLKDTPVRTEVLTGERIETSGAKNLYEIFDKGLMPGVMVNTSCTNCNFSEIRMQGLEGGYSLVLFDGLPVFSALAGVYGLRQVNVANIERIEVVKGASSALYGSSALGGVINVITKEPEKDKPIISASFTKGFYDNDETAYDADATVGLREGDVAFILTGSRHHNDYVLTNDDLFTDKIEQDLYNFSAKTHVYLFNDKHRLTLIGRALHEYRRGGYTGTKSRMIDTDEDGTEDTEVFYNAIDDSLDEDAEHITTDRWEWGAGYKAELPAGSLFKLNWIQTFHKRDATNGARPFHSEEDAFMIDLLYSHPVMKNNTVTFGGNYKEEDLEQIINYEKDKESKSKIISGFLQDEWEIIPDLDLVIGARYDNVFDSSLHEDSAVSPRAALKYSFLNDFVVRASYGWGFKVPTLFAEDLHLCSAAPTVEVPDNLESEKSVSYNAGIAYYGKRFTCDLNVFRTDIKDKINLVFVDGYSYDAVFVNAGEAYTQGFELSATLRMLDSLNLNASYTYTQAKFKDKQLESGDDGYGDSDNLLRVPDMTATLGLEHKYSKFGLMTSANCRYVGRQNVQRDMLVYEAGDDDVENGTANAGDEVTGDPIAHIDHTDGYFVFDAKISKDFRHDHWTYSVFAGCDNLFDEVQDTIYTAETEDSAAYIYAPLTGRYIYAGIKMTH